MLLINEINVDIVHNIIHVQKKRPQKIVLYGILWRLDWNYIVTYSFQIWWEYKYLCAWQKHFKKDVTLFQESQILE